MHVLGCVCVCLCGSGDVRAVIFWSLRKLSVCECLCVYVYRTESNVCSILQRVASFGGAHHAQADRCH